MSMKLDASLSETGTRFRIFPQPRFLPSFGESETVRISVPPEAIQSSPADDRMYVLDAIGKRPYDRFSQRPYLEKRNPPIAPGPEEIVSSIDIPNSG